MLARYAMAFAAFAAILTLAWLFIDDRRVTFTSGLSFVCWAVLALEGGNLEVISNGTRMSSPLSDQARLVLALLAILSLLAFILYRVGAYPPADEANVSEKTPHARGFSDRSRSRGD